MNEISIEDAARLIVILFGIGVLAGGSIMLANTVNGPLGTISGFGSGVAGLIVGGFLCMTGVLVICAGLGMLEEAAGAIGEVWDGFLSAIGRN
jgi:hypothetical protein